MHIKTSAKAVKADLLVLPVYKTKKLNVSGLTKSHELEAQQAFARKIFKGDIGETLILHNQKDSKSLYKTVALLGLGEEKDFNLHKAKEAGSKIASVASASKSSTVAVSNPKQDYGVWMAFAGYLNSYKFTRYLSKKEGVALNSITVVGENKNSSKLAKDLTNTKNAMFYTRDLVNTTSNEIGPKAMVEKAKKLAKQTKSRITVLNRKQLEKMGMGSILAVGQGSKDGPYMVTIEYKNSPEKGQKPIAIIGKGLTFDTGGINLKPTGHIETMKQDKAGACTALGILKYLHETGYKGHVIFAIGIAENLIGSGAIRPGDIIKAYNGKTIEITNTDAEGRMVLADTIAYTQKKYSPSHIISLSTLTGAAIIALGSDITALLSTDKKLTLAVLETAEEVDEPTWELPMYEDYCKKTKGTVSDLLNFSKSIRAGTIMGGAFLREFTSGTPLAHLDMGGTGWTDEGKPCYPSGATGVNIMLVAKTISKL